MSKGNGIIKEGAVTFVVNVSTLDILNRNKQLEWDVLGDTDGGSEDVIVASRPSAMFFL